MTVKGTCKKEKCPFFKAYGKECPFLVETWWESTTGDRDLIEDCAPVRSLLMQQEYYNRAIALQQSHEQARNEQAKTNAKLDQTITQTKDFMIEAEKKLIEMKHFQTMQNALLSKNEDG